MAAAGGTRPVNIELAGEAVSARAAIVDLTVASPCAPSVPRSAKSAAVESAAVAPTGDPSATDYVIEPDASAATDLWAAEVLTGGSIDLGVAAAAFSQPDAKSHEVIASFPHMPAIIDGSQMQDAVPTLAVLAAFNETPVRFTGLANLRVKECDRVRALSTGLVKHPPRSRHRGGRRPAGGLRFRRARRPDAACRHRHVRRSPHRRRASRWRGLKINGIYHPRSRLCGEQPIPRDRDELASLGVDFEGDRP